MRPVPENYFTGPIAREYATKWPHLFDPAVVDPAVAFLAERSGSGPVLELGVGTGRLALPLSRRGLRVHGIELSPDMIEELRRQPGADAIGVTRGDIATITVAEGAGTFTLAYLVRNTIMNLTTQDAQVQCFRNAAAHLVAGGRFVMEVLVPELRRLPPGETLLASGLEPPHVGIDRYDVATQGVVSWHAWLGEGDGNVENFAAPFRYVWPAELDLMARLAGMERLERWADWEGSPFTAESRSHVSVWEKTGGPAGL
jgi:SAM-dependent methyltransferase